MSSTPTQSITIQINSSPTQPGQQEQHLQHIRRILKTRIEERCPARVTGAADNPHPSGFTLALAADEGLTADSFSISQSEEQVRLAGGSIPGVFAAAGKFLRSSRYTRDGFIPSTWSGTSIPTGQVRGMYFAIHYFNWYHVAPESDFIRYIEDLALWGVNTIAFILLPFIDLQGWDDPELAPALQRGQRCARIVRTLGLRACLMLGPNSQFGDTPQELRATPLPDPLGRRGNHGVNLCPSKPAARELILNNHRRLFESIAGTGIDLMTVWPYDEGGCACDQCAPWGSNGFLSISREVVRLSRQYFPHSQTILSTWMFDTPPEGEWAGLSPALARNNDWVDYILADAHEDFPRYPLDQEVPGHLPLLNFPEISMWGLYPWGGFGATCLPERFQTLWNQVKSRATGGLAYSEGIFEDINKIIVSQFYWDKERSAADTLREYITYEYSPEVVDDVLRIVHLVESNHTRAATHHTADLAAAREAYALAQKVAGQLPERAKNCWRWRQLYLRTFLDQERYQAMEARRQAAGQDLTPDFWNDPNLWGRLLWDNEPAQTALQELVDIYYAGHQHPSKYHANVCVPLREA